MPSRDYDVGFEKEPEGLDAFLDKQGYDLIPPEGKEANRDYESREGGLVGLFYFAEAPKVEEGKVPDWEKKGYKIVAQLTISTSEDAEEAERIAHEAVREYNGVLYDPQSDKFSMSPNRN